MRGRVARALAVGLTLLGVGCFGQGLWIHAKAGLAQLLLQRAWQRTQAGENRVPPWPWADTWPVASLHAPGQDAEVIVLAGASGRTLAFGPAHLDGSAAPGAADNTVLAGHRDTHFAFLRGLEPGTEIRTEDTDGHGRVYRVAERFVTDERDASVLAPSDEPQLTLVTCWPFDTPVPGGPERYVVVAR